MSAPALTCREWGTVTIGPGGATEAEAEPLLRVARDAGRRLGVGEDGVLARVHGGLRAGQVCGVVAAGGRTLEILPKIEGEDGGVRLALLRMLAVAHELPVELGALAPLERQREDLLEVLIRRFAERLLDALRRGPARRYAGHEADLAVLRGSLDVGRQYTALLTRPGVVACRFDELGPDTALNRVLKAAAVRLRRLARTSASRRLLGEAVGRLAEARDVARPLAERVRLDRTNAAFHDVHALARLLLAGEWQTTTGGHDAGFSLLFRMNALFEAYAGRLLRRGHPPGTVRLQDQRHHALEGRRFALRPDAVIETPEATVVLDAKWKELDPTHGERLGVAQADVYQMLAYGHAYAASERLIRLVLLYPHHGGLGLSGMLRRWVVQGTRTPLEVATIDVAGRPSPAAAASRLAEALAIRPPLPHPAPA